MNKIKNSKKKKTAKVHAGCLGCDAQGKPNRNLRITP